MHIVNSYQSMHNVELLVGLGPLSFGFSYTYPCASILVPQRFLLYTLIKIDSSKLLSMLAFTIRILTVALNVRQRRGFRNNSFPAICSRIFALFL